MKTSLLITALCLSIAAFSQTGETCSDPIPLECGQSVVGSTIGVPNDNNLSMVVTCMTAVGTGGQMWFAITPDSDGEITLSTAGSLTDFDTKIHAYTGECGSLVCANGNDDFTNLTSELNLYCDSGVTYLIRIGGFNLVEGNFELSVSCDLDNHACMDPLATNFNPQAIVDDGSCCYGLYHTFSITPGSFSAEIGWSILDPSGNLIISGDYTDAAELCTSAGSCGYILVMTDDFGDGWNGGIYEFKDQQGNVIFTGTLEDGSGPDSVFIAIGDGECPFGCMNPIAENYDPEAGFDDGSCIIYGCNDMNAQNYDPVSTQDDGSCIYNYYGYAFVDLNENGSFDDFENGLADVEVVLNPDGLITFTDDMGYFEFNDIVDSDHTIQCAINNQVWPTITTSDNFDLSQTYSPFFVGVSSGEPYMNVELTSELWGFFFCGTDGSLWLTLNNNGNETINSHVEIDLDDILSPLGSLYVYGSNMPDFSFATSVNGTNPVIDLQNILPGGHVYMWLDFEVLAPEMIGQVALNHYTMSSVSSSGLIDEQSIQSENLIQCSYDPNDISVAPAGYTDNHFILNDTPLDYTIRFQNTGNAPAYHITVSNFIDENLDLTSFNLTQTGHEVVTSINLQTREILFDFYEIMLPDSFADEAGSHGFIKYRILPNSNLPVGTVIENAVGIIFDINEPVITNTAFSTITSCDNFGTFTLSENEICEGDVLSGSISELYIESYQWSMDGVVVSTTTSFTVENANSGTHEIELETENPLCEGSSSQSVVVHALESPSFNQVGAMLTAQGGTDYQWYLNGFPIEGATSETWLAQENGIYTVQSISEFGCVGVSASQEVIVIGILENDENLFQIFPNPVSSIVNLIIGHPGDYDIKMIGVDGESVRHWSNNGANQLSLDCSDLASGVYMIQLISVDGQISSRLIVVE
jgi:uncharacterized repeat protein (TIGR01451 family)